MNTATHIRELKKEFRGSAALYRMDPPYEGIHTYVIVSAAVVPFSGPETYIFPANADGEVTNWAELPGSRRGTLARGAVLRDIGYAVSGED